MKSDISFCLKVCYTEHVISYFNLRLSDESYFQEVLIMAIIDLATENFQAEITKSDKPVLVDFWAVWCGPCQMVSPIVEEISEEHPEIKVGKVNTDEQPRLASQFGITAIPTLILFKDGKPFASQTGALPKAGLEKFALQ